MAFTRYQRRQLTRKCNHENVHLLAIRQHTSTDITESDNAYATESFIENLFKNQSHLKLKPKILSNNFDGYMTDIDKSYEITSPIINQTLKLEKSAA